MLCFMCMKKMQHSMHMLKHAYPYSGLHDSGTIWNTENFTEQKCCLPRERLAKSENCRGYAIRWISRTTKQNIENSYQTFRYKHSKVHPMLQPSQVCLTPLFFNRCQKIKDIFTKWKNASSAAQLFHFIVGCILSFLSSRKIWIKKVKEIKTIWLYERIIRMQCLQFNSSSL